MTNDHQTLVIDVTATYQPDQDGQFAESQGQLLANVLEEMADLINHYMRLPNPALAMLIACWIGQTYCFRKFDYCGYLAIRSATPRCGKSKLMKIIGKLVKGTPPITTIPTAANLFRTPHEVILLDEIDKLRNRDKDKYGEVIAVLNVGYEQGTVITRLDQVNGIWVPRDYEVFGPKVLAGIEGLADTLTDRAFFLPMIRTQTRQPRLRIKRLEGRLNTIRERLELWTTTHGDTITECYDQLPDEHHDLAEFDDRFQDIAEPLYVLASIADAERRRGASDKTSSQEIRPQLLTGLRVAAGHRQPSGREEAFVAFLTIAEHRLEGQDSNFWPSNNLVHDCSEYEELEWIKTPKTLANFLRPFDLYPRQDPEGRCRGYLLTYSWFREWSQRYKRDH